MDMTYHQPQPYHPFQQPQWSEDSKPVYTGNEMDANHDSSSSGPTHPADAGMFAPNRRPSTLKVEDEVSTNDQTWRSKMLDMSLPSRHYSQPSLSYGANHGQPFMRVDPNFAASYSHPQPWAMTHSGTATPTPVYGHNDTFGAPVQYPAGFGTFTQEPISAVSMSPQSSQGGWASAASNESAEHQAAMQAEYRPLSPNLVQRSDGIRKKNARFEIPKERNLETIDAMIGACTNDQEKKELKQQKRLLRNRQAALDSRQRKKSHTEKLEQEKKGYELRQSELQDHIAALQATFEQEKQHWMAQRHNYEVALHQLQNERDEALRQRTMETGDLRRQVNALKDIIRDLESQSTRPLSYHGTSDMNGIATDFSGFNVDDDWEEFIGSNDDFKLEDSEFSHRHATPKPPTTTATTEKSETVLSKAALATCLLIGSSILSTGKLPTNTDLAAVTGGTSLDAQCVEASKVFSTVTKNKIDSNVPQVFTTPRSQQSDASRFGVSSIPSTSGSAISQLDRLAVDLTTPSRIQELQAMFSLPAASYSQIMGGIEDDADADFDDSPRPTMLEQAFADHQAKQRASEQAIGLVDKSEQRSVLMDSVSDEALQHFKDFMRETREN